MILIILAVICFFMLGGLKTSKAVGRSAERFGDYLNVKSGSLTDQALLESIQEEAELSGAICESTGCSEDELQQEIAKKRKRYGIK